MTDVIQFGESRSIFNRIVLSKESSSNQIKAYFEGVLKLYESNEKFPVDLDDVWPLVYSEKGKAVRALKKNFFEGDDYHLAQNGKVISSSEIQNGIEIKYSLTIKCLEYFIARKIREVFDVYRNVFQKIATGEVQVRQQPKTGAEMLLLYAQQMVEQEKRINEIQNKQNLLEQKIDDIDKRTDTNIHFTTIVGFANRFGMKCPIEQASALGKKAVNMCKKFGYNTGKIPDPRFGMVRTYPDDVLFEVFEEYYPNMNFRQ